MAETLTRRRPPRLGADLAGPAETLDALLIDDADIVAASLRLSGAQAAGCRFADVAFVGCRLNGANFRMTGWQRSEFEDCELAEVDFSSAALPASRFIRGGRPVTTD